MNKERMLQLADFIEQLPAHKFDMANWAIDNAMPHELIDCKALNPHQCKTAGCIAGWAIYLFSKRPPRVYPRGQCNYVQWPTPPAEAAQLLELNHEQVSDLFQGHGFEVGLTLITREMAASLMREMVAYEATPT